MITEFPSASDGISAGSAVVGMVRDGSYKTKPRSFGLALYNAQGALEGLVLHDSATTANATLSNEQRDQLEVMGGELSKVHAELSAPHAEPHKLGDGTFLKNLPTLLSSISQILGLLKGFGIGVPVGG